MVAAVGSNQIVPIEHRGQVNEHIWIDLNTRLEKATMDTEYYQFLYRSSPYVLTACSVAALAAAYFFAPSMIPLVTGGVFFTLQIVFSTGIPRLLSSISTSQNIVDDTTQFLAKERIFRREVTDWNGVREKMGSFNISADRASRIASNISSTAPHIILLRALAIEDVLRTSAQLCEQRVNHLRTEVENLQRRFLTEQFMLPEAEVEEKKEELLERKEVLFNEESHWIERKIRAAFHLSVLSRPDDRRLQKDYGEYIRSSREEALSHQHISGQQIAFVRRHDGRADVFSREWVMNTSIQEIATHLFELNEGQ